MIIKKLLLFLVFVNFVFASFQEVRVGKIDNYYQDKLSSKQLQTIINEIEYTFESQLGKNIFDYSSTGKDIDILFVSPSKLEQRIQKKIEKSNIQKEKIRKIKAEYLPKKQEEINILQNKFNSQTTLVNKKSDEINAYIKKINEKKTLSNDEYLKAQNYVKVEKKNISILVIEQKKRQKDLIKALNHYNQKVNSYNNLVIQSNSLSNEIESMTRSFKKVKGKTFGQKEITMKTYYKDGKKVSEKNIVNSMNKIEIYGFENLHQLKVVLAHEIAHLVGIPHINVSNALMNPILQDNQNNELVLTYDDIENFKRNF